MCLDSVRASVPVLERNMWLHAAADGRVLVHGVLADRRHGADSCLPCATLWHPHHSASLRKLPKGACFNAGVPAMEVSAHYMHVHVWSVSLRKIR